MSTNERHSSQQRRAVWPPEAGLFSLRLVRNGWAVPAEIRQTEAGWQAIVDGREHAPNPDPAHAELVERVWIYGRRVSAGDHAWLQQVGAHARAHDPDHPAATPTKPIRPGLLRPL